MELTITFVNCNGFHRLFLQCCECKTNALCLAISNKILVKCILFLCRQNCSDKMDAFLSRTFHVNGGYDNNKGMSKLNSLMEQIEVVIRGHSLIEKKFFSFHWISLCSIFQCATEIFGLWLMIIKYLTYCRGIPKLIGYFTFLCPKTPF